MSWIQTYTGRKFDLLAPTPDMVCIEDIAHALSLLCRFTGHTSTHYSVAQHSVYVARYCEGTPNTTMLQALLHDATEAYVGDVSSPLKAMLPAYQEIESRVWQAIAIRFGVPFKMYNIVKEADVTALSTERRDLMSFSPEPWELPYKPHPTRITPLSAAHARQSFLDEFTRLKGVE